MLRRATPWAGSIRQTRPRQPPNRRLYAADSHQSAPPPSSRMARLQSRLPRFLHRFVVPLRDAPVSHITAFLVLHELTAVVPLLGLTAFFHYSHWLPPGLAEGKWVSEGTQKFGRYLRKKGWIAEEDRSGRWWGRGEGSVRIVVELATAYAITKALLPLRLIGSVWATPWFARWTVLPFTRFLKSRFGRSTAVKSTATGSAAAGTGVVGGAVVPKETQAKVK